MRERTSISRLLAVVVLAYGLAVPAASLAQTGGASSDRPIGDDEIITGPFSDYGEFDSGEDEEADERFFQYGRFFGVGIGTGLTTATGNAGRIYQGGFPMVDFRLNYWFDFQYALQIDVQNSKHNYDISPHDLTEVNFFRIMGQVKYFLDTRDLSAPITFVGPHFILGGGFYQRTDNIGSGSSTSLGEAVQSQQTFGLNAGGGLELTLKSKKTYLDIEFLGHFVQWGDSFDTVFASAGIPDRSGTWFTLTTALVWTW